MIKVKANEELFNQWRQIGHKITNLASIVQNDMEIEEKELAEWQQLYYEQTHLLKAIHSEIMTRLHYLNDNFDARLVTAYEKLLKEQQS